MKETVDIAFDELMAAESPVQILNKTAERQPLNQCKPAYTVKHERPSHRIVLEMTTQGYTDREIAATLGMTPTAVGYIRKQPFYNQILADEIHRKLSEDEKVVNVIKDNVVMVVESLVDIVKDGDLKASDRIAAANALLDRRYGKPNQPINRGTDVDLNSLSDAELAAMLPETQRTGTNT